VALNYDFGTVNIILVIVVLAHRFLSLSAHVTDLSPSPSVSLCVSVGRSVGLSGNCTVAKWLPFGMVSGFDLGMGVLDGVVIVKGEGAVLGVNMGRPIVTIGDFVA